MTTIRILALPAFRAGARMIGVYVGRPAISEETHEIKNVGDAARVFTDFLDRMKREHSCELWAIRTFCVGRKPAGWDNAKYGLRYDHLKDSMES